jgi:hypothetical protein
MGVIPLTVYRVVMIARLPFAGFPAVVHSIIVAKSVGFFVWYAAIYRAIISIFVTGYVGKIPTSGTVWIGSSAVRFIEFFRSPYRYTV